MSLVEAINAKIRAKWKSTEPSKMYDASNNISYRAAHHTISISANLILIGLRILLSMDNEKQLLQPSLVGRLAYIF